MKRFFLFFLSAISSVQVMAQDNLPGEADQFVPAGFTHLDYKTGDLNGDKKPDAILILKQLNEDSLTDEEPLRPFLILIRQASGKLALVKKNDDLVMCRHCGGMFGDPYADLQISGTGFSIFFYGGSNWRWAYEYAFRYNPTKKNWYLVKESQSYFNSGDMETTYKEIEITAPELGEVSVDEFDSIPENEYGEWNVIAAKTYFYDTPKLGSPHRKGYLVRGNIANVTRVLKNFVEVNFENKDGEITTGFLLKKDLVKSK